MTLKTFPTLARGPQGGGARVIANTAVNRSPLTGSVQVLQRPGTRLIMSVTFNRRANPDRAILQGFLAGLYGQEHTVLYDDPKHTIQRGVLSGTPLVNGASQTGEALIIDGVGSVSDWIMAGDHLSFDNGTYRELKIVTADVTSSAGNATIPISPEIHISPANNAAIDISMPVQGTWHLLDAEGAEWDDEVGDRSTFVIEFEEHIE